MKIIVFVPTGEVRSAKQGEWAGSDDGGVWRALRDMDRYHEPILTHHEIEVPDAAESFKYYFYCGEPQHGYTRTCEIPIPRPKKKVKKWQWVAVDETRNPYVSIGFYTKDEFIAQYKICNGWYHPVEETMIEVEENV